MVLFTYKYDPPVIDPCEQSSSLNVGNGKISHSPLNAGAADLICPLTKKTVYLCSDITSTHWCCI